MKITPTVTATLLADVTPTEVGVLDGYRAGIQSQTTVFPSTLDQIAISEKVVPAGESVTLNLADFSVGSDLEAGRDPDCEPVNLEKVYGLLVVVKEVNGDEGAVSVLLDGLDSDAIQDSSSESSGLPVLSSWLEGKGSLLLKTWPEGLYVDAASLVINEETGDSDVSVTIVALGIQEGNNDLFQVVLEFTQAPQSGDTGSITVNGVTYNLDVIFQSVVDAGVSGLAQQVAAFVSAETVDFVNGNVVGPIDGVTATTNGGVVTLTSSAPISVSSTWGGLISDSFS